MRTQIILSIFFVFLVSSCAPEPNGLQDASEGLPTATPQAEFPPMTPQEWILSHPIQPAPAGQAEVVVDGLPEGYQPQEIQHQTAALPDSGFEVGITQVTYEKSSGGQVSTKDSVTVRLSSHQNLEARSEHLGLMIEAEDSWEYLPLGGQLTARFSSSSADGRIWVSGPYLVAIWSSQDISAGDPELDPMVEAFTALYLNFYPAE